MTVELYIEVYLITNTRFSNMTLFFDTTFYILQTIGYLGNTHHGGCNDRLFVISRKLLGKCQFHSIIGLSVFPRFLLLGSAYILAIDVNTKNVFMSMIPGPGRVRDVLFRSGQDHT